MVHTDVFESEINLNKVVGQVRRELDDLVSEVFNKLIVDVGYPGLEPDGHVLKQKVNRLLFL